MAVRVRHHLLRFTYSSMTTPTEVWDYDLAGRARMLRKREEIPRGHDAANYVTRRLSEPAADGELFRSRCFIARILARRRRARTFYGYGAYGIAIPAGFVPPVLARRSRLCLRDRACAWRLREGPALVPRGKLAKKTNTFTDFIAVREFLISHGLSAGGKVVADGGSAGGMLMGAIAKTPGPISTPASLLKFLSSTSSTQSSITSLPLTPPEWPEWGNPRINPN